SIGINYSTDSEICDGLTHGMYLTLMQHLSEIGYQDRLVPAEPVISALRERKSDDEVNRMREAIRITEGIFADVACFIQPGQTEAEIAQYMQTQLALQGFELAWEETVCPAVFTGPDTAGAHYAPTEKKVARGHVLNMDFGVKYEDYCSDLQRTFYILEEGETTAPPDVMKGFDTIVQSIAAAKAAIKPGRQGHEIDAITRGMIVEAGYEEYPHALGHQVGRFAHDGTALLGPAWEKYAQKPFRPLEPGMVFTIEPRLTIPGRGVATIEEMVVVTADGAEWLSTRQTELILID
ncbi:MAG: Xaa-Pro peptidase family protein, partial [bacterium]